MFKKIIYSVSLLLLVAFCTNSDNPIETKTDLLVRGILKIQDSPIIGAEVQIDDVLNWKTTTDEEGYFEIKNVTKGEHVLQSSSTNDNGQVVSVESTISVNEGTTDLGEIRLPEPPILFDIDITQALQNKLTLHWSSSLDEEFREYKIYRKDDAGLDENTGELIYVSTEIQDTTFIDNSFNMGLEYFYRVYTLSAFGKLGGSNIVSTPTPQPTMVENGDFEIWSDNLIPSWNYMYDPNSGLPGKFTLDSNNVGEGKYSLAMTRAPDLHGDINIDQSISSSKLIVGGKYTFSLMLKSDSVGVGGFVYYKADGNMNILTFPQETSIAENTDWVTVSTEFVFPSDANVLTVRLYAYETMSSQNTLKGWYDNVKIELIE